jgi:hypothetical protein
VGKTNSTRAGSTSRFGKPVRSRPEPARYGLCQSSSVRGQQARRAPLSGRDFAALASGMGRLSMERMEFDLRFRWLVGLGVDEQVLSMNAEVEQHWSVGVILFVFPDTVPLIPAATDIACDVGCDTFGASFGG